MPGAILGTGQTIEFFTYYCTLAVINFIKKADMMHLAKRKMQMLSQNVTKGLLWPEKPDETLCRKH